MLIIVTLLHNVQSADKIKTKVVHSCTQYEHCGLNLPRSQSSHPTINIFLPVQKHLDHCLSTDISYTAQSDRNLQEQESLRDTEWPGVETHYRGSTM